MKIYIGITSIPGREKGLVKCVNSILSGEYIPFKIIISLPLIYKNAKKKYNINLIKSLEKSDKVVIIRNIEDYGPITKFLGVINFIKKEKNIIPKNFIVCCDDDLIYKKDALKMMVNQIKIQRYLSCSFYTYINNKNRCIIGQGADMFAVRFDIIKNLHIFYNSVVSKNKLLFYHDDLVVSFFLNKKRIKIERIKYSFFPFIQCYQHIDTNVSGLVNLKGKKSRYNLNKILVL